MKKKIYFAILEKTAKNNWARGVCVLRVARYFAASSLRSESIWLVYGAVEDARMRPPSGLSQYCRRLSRLLLLRLLTFTLEASPKKARRGTV